MGMSANQARFLSITSRQVDLEYRMQQICQRRLRLANELENVATTYNNKISDRKLFVSDNNLYDSVSFSNLESMGFSLIDNETNRLVGFNVMNTPTPPDAAATVINSEAEFLNLVSVMNGGDAAATTALGGNYVLNCDIDLSDNGVLTDALIGGNFTGTFDGQGHVVSGLVINSTQNQVGVFSSTSATAEIKNLGVYGADITSTGNEVGVLVGYNHGTIDNCFSEGLVSGNQEVGGLVGNNENNSISNSYAAVDVTGTYQVGGFVGYNDQNNADIANCYASGDVQGGDWVGGFAGASYNDGSIDNSYATGAVNGSNLVGGFIGKMGYVDITNSYAIGAVSGSGTTGGFAGETYNTGASTIYDTCFWNTDIYSAGIGNDLNGGFHAQGLTTDQIANQAYTVNGGWAPADWDMSGDVPILQGAPVKDDDILEAMLRNGSYSIAKEADNLTQNPISLGGVSYEVLDWRTVTEISDDLDTSNDIDAQAEYETTIEKINAKDKKLQLEQSNIEVEYKAITTQRDAVNNLIKKNIEGSFKTFS